jgi:PAS domain S-box-containing protein
MSDQERGPQLSPEAYRTLVEGVPAVLYIDEPDDVSTPRYTSPRIMEVLGYSPQEWDENPSLWVNALHPDDRAATVEAHHVSNRAREMFLADYRIYAKDGRLVWIRDEAAPVFGDDGQLLYWRGVMLDITEQKEAESKLRWSLDVLRRTIQQRRELASRLESAQEEERRRIAADIHDDPIQVMSAVDMRLQLLAAMPATATSEELLDIQQTVRDSIERLRNLLFELRPLALDRDGLVPALGLYLEHIAGDNGWTYTVADGLSQEPPPELRATLYRIAQEALTNTRKHADATHIEIAVATAGDGVTIRITDDGKGFEPSMVERPEPGHLGLSTMVERAELVGGWCRIASAPGRGATVECWLPVDTAVSVPAEGA